MKVALALLIAFTVASFDSFSQDDKTNKAHTFHQLSFTSAISFPSGDFGNTNINDKSSGFAQTGYSFEIAYHSHSKKRPIAVYTALSFSGYEVDFKPIDVEMKRNQPDKIFRSNARTSTVTAVKVGVTGFFRRDKIRGYITPYAGYAFLKSDLITDKFHSTGALDLQTRVVSSISDDDEDAI